MLIALLNRMQYYRRRVYSRLLQRWGGFRSCGSVSIDPGIRIENPEMMTLGSGILVLRGSWLYCIPGHNEAGQPPDLTIDSGCYLGYNSHITCARKIRLGEGCVLANGVYISDCQHRFEDLDTPILQQGLKVAEVEIGERVWIGEYACIFGQVKIGRGCVIGAHSVVTNRELPDYSVVVGAPARIVKRYDFESRTWRRTDAEGQFLNLEGVAKGI